MLLVLVISWVHLEKVGSAYRFAEAETVLSGSGEVGSSRSPKIAIRADSYENDAYLLTFFFV